MATLQALAISGIRGYTPEKLQRIDFTHPLTLINGKNGSGKTTIIQCLKYITTGVLPPSSRMQKSFVMDPNIAGTAQVKGDIRLRFRTAKNRVVIAKKVIMVSKTSKGMTSKAVEQSLKTKDEEGKQIEVSQRCADIEKQIPEMLGITKPILDNIVFCHQDQSLWPFSDNNTLKGIFDELFDTKRFTKTIENLKQGIKDYEKERIQIKSQLQYLKASYYKFIQNRNESLSGLVEVVEASQQICKVREQLEPLKCKIKQISSKETTKNSLISNKGVLQYKLLDYNEKLQKIEEKSKLENINIRSLENANDQIENIQNLQRIGEQIKQKQKQIKVLYKILQQIKEKESTNKRKNEFYMQIKRIKQILPEINEMNSSKPDAILLKISQKLKEMARKAKSLSQIKSKLSNLTIPYQQSQSQINDSKLIEGKLQIKNSQLQRLQKKIRSIYNAMYDPNIKQDNSGITGESKRANQRLNKIQAQIELKKIQLKKYQQLKPRNKSLEQQIYEIKYTGVQLQKEMLEYARKKKECGLCMRKLSDQDIEDLKLKMAKTIKKSEARIEELKRSYNPLTDIDPAPIIREIQSFIQSSSKTMRILEEEKIKYDKYICSQNQMAINRQLNKVMQSLELKSAMVGMMGTGKEKESMDGSNYSIEQLRQIANEYKMVMSECKNLNHELLRSKQRSIRQQETKNAHEQKIKQKQGLQAQCHKLEASLGNYLIIQNIYKKLEELNTLIKRDEQKQSNSQESSSDLNNQIEHSEFALAEKKKQKLIVEMNLESIRLAKERDQCKLKLKQIIQQISAIMAERNQNSELELKKNRLEVEQAKLTSKIQLKKSIHARYLQQEPLYLTKLLKYNAVCSMISDIQATMKAMERATNRLHNEKMDQINKILFDIWQDVYHAKDIEFIRINSVMEKKNNGFGYSIMMQKNGQMIEMKGRCSMGQKVLASLIIRMALAEAFSASTHILTLDEPTTNLDRTHIENLAESISSIIQMQQNSRLQLIIISHDMQFLGLLKKHTNYFYEISRNEKNFSTITKKQIGVLGQDNVIVPKLQAIHY